MKFSTAVDSLTKENSHLRFTIKLLSAAIIGLTFVVISMHNKAPIVVERSTHGLELVHAAELYRTDEDIMESIRHMIRARFDTAAISPDLFLSHRQMELREVEQQEMKSRGISQSVLFRSAKVTSTDAVVEFDRVLSVGDIRSALKTTIKIGFEEAQPNELNPYGLKLALVAPIEQPKEQKK